MPKTVRKDSLQARKRLKKESPGLPIEHFEDLFVNAENAQRLDLLSRLDTEESFRFIAEAIPTIVWTQKPNGDNDYFNKRWFEYTGLTEKESYEEQKTVLHPDDHDRYFAFWRSAIERGQPYEIEYRFRRASDGIYRWQLERGLPVKDRNGTIIKWLGTCTDIDDQKKAQEQMKKMNEELERQVLARTEDLEKEIHERIRMEERERANLQRLKDMINVMPMAALATDESFTILHANQLFATLFLVNTDTSDLIGSNVIDLLNNVCSNFESGEAFRSLLQRITEQDMRPFRMELSMMDERTFSCDYRPILENMIYRGHLLLLRDITQEKRTDTAKSEFMSLASHQLRTPLTTIRWSIGRLEKKMPVTQDKEPQRLLGRAKQAIAHMTETIRTMLMISRVEAGKMNPKISAIPLRHFLETLRMDFAESCLAKNITLDLRCDPSLELESDADLLKQILQNLVSNAIKYSPTSGTVELEAVLSGRTVIMNVHDDGYGIPATQQHRVFKKFFRASNVTDKDTEGTGLGLYLVWQLIKILRGKVSFVSEEQRGSVFSIELPQHP